MLFNSTKGIRFDKRGLIPAIIQDADTKKVLMYVYMNKEAVKKTRKTGELWLYHRSMKKTWKKGSRSGNSMQVVDMFLHHDHNVMLVQVLPNGPACHTGNESCFFQSYLHDDKPEHSVEANHGSGDDGLEALRRLFERESLSDEVEVVTNRDEEAEKNLLAEIFSNEAEEPIAKNAAPTGKSAAETEKPDEAEREEEKNSDFLGKIYENLTGQLALGNSETQQREISSVVATQIAQKIGENAVQLAIMATQGDSKVLVQKEADILQQLLILLAAKGIPLDELKKELVKRVI